mgnify:CR=1 FL=1
MTHCDDCETWKGNSTTRKANHMKKQMRNEIMPKYSMRLHFRDRVVSTDQWAGSGIILDPAGRTAARSSDPDRRARLGGGSSTTPQRFSIGNEFNRND